MHRHLLQRDEDAQRRVQRRDARVLGRPESLEQLPHEARRLRRQTAPCHHLHWGCCSVRAVQVHGRVPSAQVRVREHTCHSFWSKAVTADR